MSGRALVAWIDGIEVGTLHEADGIWQFQYASPWVNTGYALSPALPLQTERTVDSGTQRPVQWYFDNLLPEEDQRQLLARDAKLESADAFALLGYYGAESAGSLTLLPEGEPVAPAGGLRPLPDEELSARIRALPNQPLTHGAHKRMSLAGAQHKLAVVVRDGQLYEPVGAEPSTHILKPDHPSADYPHSVANEWFVMTLARRLGFDVPAIDRRYIPEPVYLVARFDRDTTTGVTRRRHAIDACQLLGIDRQFKYIAGSVETLSRLSESCRAPAAARQRLFKWLAFNALIGNGDAHLKNLSFLVDRDQIALAPHYDVLSTGIYATGVFDRNEWPEHTELAWPIGEVSRFADVRTDVLVEAADTLKLGARAAERIVSKLKANLFTTALLLLDEVEDENTRLVKARPDIASTLAGEERALRGITYVVIKDMVDGLDLAPASRPGYR